MEVVAENPTVSIIRKLYIGNVESSSLLKIMGFSNVEFPTIVALQNVNDVQTVAVKKTIVYPCELVM